MFTKTIFNQTISYSITDAGVHLINDRFLHLLVKKHPKKGVYKLAEILKKHFNEINQRPLQISLESLVSEIWGHYFFEKIYSSFRGVLKLLFFNKIVNRLDISLQEYDCGERGFDPNRRMWNLLSKCNGLFSLLLTDEHSSQDIKK